MFHIVLNISCFKCRSPKKESAPGTWRYLPWWSECTWTWCGCKIFSQEVCLLRKHTIGSPTRYTISYYDLLNTFSLSFFDVLVSLRQQPNIGWTRRCSLVHNPLSLWAVWQLTVGQNVFLTLPVTSLMSLFLCVEVLQKIRKYPKVYNRKSYPKVYFTKHSLLYYYM